MSSCFCTHSGTMMYLAVISVFLRTSLTAGAGQPTGNSRLHFWVQIWHIMYLDPSDMGSRHQVMFKMSGTCFSSSRILEQGSWGRWSPAQAAFPPWRSALCTLAGEIQVPAWKVTVHLACIFLPFIRKWSMLELLTIRCVYFFTQVAL